MAKLTDLPEELLSYICDEIDKNSLVSLAVTCRQLNRLAGSRYLKLIELSNFLSLSPTRTWNSIDFDELQNVLKILHGLRNVFSVSCMFSEDPHIALRQMKLLTLALRRMSCVLLFFSLDFPLVSVPASKVSSKGARRDQIFHKAWEDLIRGAQCPGFSSLRIGGVPPFLPHAPIGKFGLSQNTSLTTFTIDPVFLFDQPHRDWLKSFLNSCPSISAFQANHAKEWTHLLPEIHLPSLQDLQFTCNGHAAHAYTSQVSLEVLAEFCERHKLLNRLICGPGFRAPSSTTDLGNRGHYLLSSIQYIQATVAQFQYFLSSSAACPNLRTIEIETSPADLEIRKLFPLLNQHPSVQRLIVHHDKPGLVRHSNRRRFRSMKLLHVRFIALEYQTWPCHPEAVTTDLLRWAARMMISAQVLEVLGIGAWKDEDKSSLAQRVAEEWPSIKFLRISNEVRHVRSWFEEEEPDLEEDQWMPAVPNDRGLKDFMV